MSSGKADSPESLEFVFFLHYRRCLLLAAGSSFCSKDFSIQKLTTSSDSSLSTQDHLRKKRGNAGYVSSGAVSKTIL